MKVKNIATITIKCYMPIKVNFCRKNLYLLSGVSCRVAREIQCCLMLKKQEEDVVGRNDIDQGKNIYTQRHKIKLNRHNNFNNIKKEVHIAMVVV